MKNKLIIFLSLFGLAFVFSSCEKDEEKVYLQEPIDPPTLVSIPDNLVLQRVNATDTLVFTGTPLDPGFVASARYFLEACPSGNNFEDAKTLFNDIHDSVMKISVADMNEDMLDLYPEFTTNATDFRIRGRLVYASGRGAIGSSGNYVEVTSAVTTADVTVYGLPRIDLVNSGTEQSLSSPAGDGLYAGLVELDTLQSFSIFDPETGTTYGGSDGNLVADGAALVPPGQGWNKLMVDLNTLSYELDPYSVGIVGAFTEWGGQPDILMDYNKASSTWVATDVNLPVGPMKFRLNSAWDIRWGPGSNTDLPENGEIDLPNADADINIVTAGNYDIELVILSDGPDAGDMKGNASFNLKE